MDALVLFAIPADVDLDELTAVDLDAEERAHAAGLTADARARYVTRRMKLREEVAFRTGIRPEHVGYWREPCTTCGEPHGRPRATGYAGYFSSSSTRGVGALVFADAPIGVDVEQLASPAAVADVLPLLHPNERDVISSALGRDEMQGRHTFTQIWTRKEALLKATGEGLGAPLDRDDVSDPTAAEAAGWTIVDITSDLVGFGDAADDAPAHGAWAMRGG